MACLSLEFIKPQLATAVDRPPPRAGWIHEVKYDGYRTLLIIERRGVRVYTRNGFDWTEHYASITMPAAKLECRSAIVDGEVIVQDERGISDFEALNSAIRWHPRIDHKANAARLCEEGRRRETTKIKKSSAVRL
jgi:bifunctional non-homologous end joining protein LigD